MSLQPKALPTLKKNLCAFFLKNMMQLTCHLEPQNLIFYLKTTIKLTNRRLVSTRQLHKCIGDEAHEGCTKEHNNFPFQPCQTHTQHWYYIKHKSWQSLSAHFSWKSNIVPMNNGPLICLFPLCFPD